MDEYLWPARHVAEYAYCPRLFYFMEVEGIYLPSGDTEQGNAVHKRVHKPGAGPRGQGGADDEALDPNKPRSVRSLTLSSAALGLTATLDLAEIEGKTAVPVEYRKGRPKLVAQAALPDAADLNDPKPASVEPWPTDRVQVGLQAILLEEAGYSVREAVLYYAAERRRVTIVVDETLKAEALAVLQSARQAATGSRPLPLVNDPRCVRCSLQPICLPDEVNNQREETTRKELAGAAQADSTGPPRAQSMGATPDGSASSPRAGSPCSPRAIWPPRDDAIHLVAQHDGARIGIRGMALKVTDREGAAVQEVPLASVESLAVLGSVQISTQAVGALADRGIPVAYLSAAGRLVAMIDPLDSVSAQIRRQQVHRLDDPAACLELSRALVVAKIINQRTLLMRNCQNLPQGASDELSRQVEQAGRAPSLDVLRGHEGQAAAVYFGHFAGMLKSELAAEFDANGRQRRPPPDPVNAALSLAYTMLTHDCVSALRLARLEPSIGAFHTSRPGRPALALDLMEPFRPLVSDSIAISAFNRGELTEGHFLRTAAGCALTDSGRKAFFGALGRRMDTEVTHPVFGYRLSYRRMIMLHARMIAAWMLGEVPGLAFLTTR